MVTDEQKQPSTHLDRKTRRMVDNLEVWLEDWGADQREPIKELSSPVKTSLKVIEEMRPEKQKEPLPNLIGSDGHLLPKWLVKIILELRWKRSHDKSTVTMRGKVPECEYRYNLRRLSKAIGLLDPLYYGIIVMRYEQGQNAADVNKLIGLSLRRYYKRVKQAKKIIRENLKIVKII